MRTAARLILAGAILAALAGAQASTTQRQQLQTTILQTLINDPELGQYPLAASVGADRKVVLNGVVPSKADREEAARLVKSIPGVAGVDNEITVNASATPLPTAAANPAAPATAATTPNTEAPSADDVQTAIQNALAADTALRGVQVSVNAATVTLSGTVATAADRKRAEKIAARNAAGRKVLDRIQLPQLR